MLDISKIYLAPLNKMPFKYSVIKDLIHPDYASELKAALPKEGNYRSVRDEGSDKVYNVVNNIILQLGEESYNKNSKLQPIWVDLVEQFQGKLYREALSKMLDEDVTNCPMEITLKRYGHKDYISPHTDKEQVRATHLIFLNNHWEQEWGGLLHFLNEDQKDFSSFLPTTACSVAFVRAENSWHRACPVIKEGKERIALQVAFWNVVDRTVAPGRKLQSISYD